jgi:hypothetical protein
MYFESVRDSLFSYDAAEEVARYRELFEDLRNISLCPRGKFDYLKRAASEIRRGSSILLHDRCQPLVGRQNSCISQKYRSGGSAHSRKVITAFEIATIGTAVLVRDIKNRSGEVLSFSPRSRKIYQRKPDAGII